MAKQLKKLWRDRSKAKQERVKEENEASLQYWNERKKYQGQWIARRKTVTSGNKKRSFAEEFVAAAHDLGDLHKKLNVMGIDYTGEKSDIIFSFETGGPGRRIGKKKSAGPDPDPGWSRA